jgi:hypothetical protein
MGWVGFSALQSETDDNGQKHVILCRVILGNVEEVQAGSQQCHPSSEDFDTGADDAKNPKRYVVWFADMNRNILPECVVSYKSSDKLPGINGSSCLVCFDFCIRFSCLKLVVPSLSFSGQVRASAKYPFGKLFSKMESFLPTERMQELTNLYDTFRVSRQLSCFVGVWK